MIHSGHIMTTQAQRLLDLLVKQMWAGRFSPGKPDSYLGYRECHTLLALQRKGGTWGRSLQNQGLNDLATWLQETHMPAITGLIVDTTQGHRPGHGYFKAFNNNIENDAWWREEIRRAIAFDWSPYSTDEELPSQDETAEIEQLYSEGGRTTMSMGTRTRCEALVKRAKSYFRSPDGKLHCTVCDWHRPTSTIEGDIVEIHHLQPLASFPLHGATWTLNEALKQLAPLCPTCHRVTHAGPNGSTLTLDQLRTLMGRSVSAPVLS